jgi:hypothetical protein
MLEAEMQNAECRMQMQMHMERADFLRCLFVFTF